MKQLMLALAILTLVACENPDGSTSQTSTPVVDPANDSTVPAIDPNVAVPAPTPSPAPVVVVSPSPAPAPSPSPAPVVVTPSPTPSAPVMPSGTLKQSSFGGYTCAIQADNKVWCSDGQTAVVTTMGGFVDVLVGDGAACALQREQTPFVSGTPQNCAYLSSTSCTKPATYYATYCWSGSSTGPVKMQTQSQTYAAVQASGLSTWITGPLALSLDATNKVCINQGVYDLHSNPQSRHTQTIGVCGNQVMPNGYLQ